jgi:hypothetical protein
MTDAELFGKRGDRAMPIGVDAVSQSGIRRGLGSLRLFSLTVRPRRGGRGGLPFRFATSLFVEAALADANG